jgi:predicted nuclease of predicted toxin-antitoxin system
MLRLATDADVDGKIVRGLRRCQPDIDLVRVQDAGLRTADDEAILEWVANEGRILISGDRNTLVGFAWARVRSSQRMPGVFALARGAAVGDVIDAVILAI